MKNTLRMAAVAVLLPLSVSGCLGSGGTEPSQASVLVSELSTICGSIVGGQAEQRINQQWAKYPEAQANRSMIETMAQVLLNNPDATQEQKTVQYKQYMTCATGLLVANGMVQ